MQADNGLRLSLQSGFAWLDDQGAVVAHRDDFDTAAAVNAFMSDLSGHSNDWTSVSERLTARLAGSFQPLSGQPGHTTRSADPEEFDRMVQDATAPLDEDRWERERRCWQEGLATPAQRHEAILYVGYYLWFGAPAAGDLRRVLLRIVDLPIWALYKIAYKMGEPASE